MLTAEIVVQRSDPLAQAAYMLKSGFWFQATYLTHHRQMHLVTARGCVHRLCRPHHSPDLYPSCSSSCTSTKLATEFARRDAVLKLQVNQKSCECICVHRTPDVWVKHATMQTADVCMLQMLGGKGSAHDTQVIRLRDILTWPEWFCAPVQHEAQRWRSSCLFLASFAWWMISSAQPCR